MKNLNSILPFLFLLLTLAVNAQEQINFENPSFEDFPRKGGEFSGPIQGWTDCGLLYFPGESPPDIHPVTSTSRVSSTPVHAWNVTTSPHQGETYLGLVARYNDTWEAVSQTLESPLLKDSCYTLSVWLCQSNSYLSNTPRSKETLENFIKPIALYIWGGNSACVMSRVLAMAGPIDHSEWKEYVLEFTPTQDFTSIVLQAYFFAPNNPDQLIEPIPYNGHVLVDQLSPISRVGCE